MSSEERNPWKDAILDELVVCGILTQEHEENPRKAVKDAIMWNMSTALDPLVSEDARKLRDGEFVEVAHIRSKNLHDVEFHGTCPDTGIPLYVKEEHLSGGGG